MSMRLKSIEIFGFKSFGKKTVIDFTGPVTAIVGPNGSGKSNIVDAVRWVLGEQRVKSLRGNKMEDVIFSGSVSKRALGYAQVTITLDNSDKIFNIDYDEIELTRRLFRSGESEYLINKTKCRLMDIQNLLMDTGLSREGYSIISQGQIESVVSNSPQERKLLIEEAVGIVKYRTRRQDAEKKLEKASANLYRITDLISEIESRLPNLKRQAQKAENYRVLANELRDIEVSVFVSRMDMLENSLEKAKKDKEELEYTLSQISEEIASCEEEKNGLNISLEELNEKIRALSELVENEEGKYSEKENALNSLVSQNTIEEEKINFITSRLELQRKNLTSLNERKKELDEDIIIKTLDSERLKGIYEEIFARSEDARKYREEAEKILEDIDEKTQAVRQDLMNIRENIITLSARKDSLADSITSEKASAEERRKEIISLRENIGEDIFSEKLTAAKEAWEIKKEELEKITGEGESVREEISAAFTSLQTKDSRLKLLKGYDESLQGYKYAVRKINELTEKDEYFRRGIRGILGEVITSRPEHAQAISRALGGAVEYVITSDENVAGRAISELKKNSWGRLTFLPENIIRSQDVRLDMSVKNMPGYIGLATELVGCEDEFRAAVDSVLYRTVVCDNLDNANRIARKVNYRHKIVTLDGDVIMSGGAMVGGKSRNEDGGVLARKAEISLLEEEIIRDRENYNALLGKRSELSAEYKKLKQETDGLQEKYENIRREKSDFDLENRNTLSRISRLEGEVSAIEGRISLKEEEISSIKKDISLLEENSSEGEKILDELLKKREEASKDDEGDVITLLEELSKANVNYLSAEREVEFLEKSIEDLKESITSSEEDISLGEKNIASSRESISDAEKEISALREEMKGISEKKGEYLSELSALRTEHGETSGNIAALSEKIVSLLSDKATVAENAGKAQSAVSKVELQIENLTSNMFESYEITYSEAKEMTFEKDTDMSSGMQRIGELKEKIKRLGNINADAIEEYENERNRFEEMTLQRDDLISSKEELSGIIDDMSKNMLMKFKKEFAAIQKEFNSVFRELFSGGEAKLVLTEPDDILSSGVDIIASPPGTKLKNISALSGGEKTMTAISLIFAIIRIKPSPFIILDETDAALDDANVVRYCNFLRSIVDENQFIIITHKKKTMENCDVLYGATMAGDGITKIVSVRLSDINEKGELT